MLHCTHAECSSNISIAISPVECDRRVGLCRAVEFHKVALQNRLRLHWEIDKWEIWKKEKKETYRQKDNQLQSWQPHQTSCCELWAWDKHYIVDIYCGWIRLRKNKKKCREDKNRKHCKLKRKQPNTPTCKIHSLFYSGDLHFPPIFSVWPKTGDLLCSCTTHVVLQVNTSLLKPPDKKKKKKAFLLGLSHNTLAEPLWQLITVCGSLFSPITGNYSWVICYLPATYLGFRHSCWITFRCISQVWERTRYFYSHIFVNNGIVHISKSKGNLTW